MIRRVLSAAAAFAMLAACTAGSATPSPAITLTTTQAPTASPTEAPTPTDSPAPSPTSTVVATPEPTISLPSSPAPTLAIGLPGPTCINGYKGLPADDAKYIEGLEILTSYMGLPDPLIVEDNRYFVGPDPDWILEPRFEAVEHWYFKATLSTDPTYRGRWLVEKRSDTRLGVSAVAPYDTVGYQSPDWSGFEGDGEPRVIAGLPGLWAGVQYDFVTGEGDGGNPGLAESQSDCMLGT
jgi:hypothetical protein